MQLTFCEWPSYFNWSNLVFLFYYFLQSDAAKYENFLDNTGAIYYSVIAEEWSPNKTAGYMYIKNRGNWYYVRLYRL